MGNTFKTVLVACAAIAVALVSAETVQSGLNAQLSSKFQAFLDNQKSVEKAVLDSNMNLVDGLTGATPVGVK